MRDWDWHCARDRDRGRSASVISIPVDLPLLSGEVGEPDRSSSPHLARDLDNPAELGPLLFFGQNVAFFSARKPALRTQA